LLRASRNFRILRLRYMILQDINILGQILRRYNNALLFKVIIMSVLQTQGHYSTDMIMTLNKRALLYRRNIWPKILISWSIIYRRRKMRKFLLARNNSWNYLKISGLLIKVIIMSVLQTHYSTDKICVWKQDLEILPKNCMLKTQKFENVGSLAPLTRNLL